MILLIDNYDSFVWNLARYVSELGHTRIVVRNDATSLDEHRGAGAHATSSSRPAPARPPRPAISNAVIAALRAAHPDPGRLPRPPVHRRRLGGKVDRARRPMHGKTSLIRHDGSGVFAGLPDPLAGHPLPLADRARTRACPDCLRVTARSEEGEIMALRAPRATRSSGVQFHPEAVLTEHGHDLLRNFLALRSVTARDSSQATEFAGPIASGLAGL